MAERNVLKTRLCKKCNKSSKASAIMLKTHAEGCQKVEKEPTRIAKPSPAMAAIIAAVIRG